MVITLDVIRCDSKYIYVSIPRELIPKYRQNKKNLRVKLYGLTFI